MSPFRLHLCRRTAMLARCVAFSAVLVVAAIAVTACSVSVPFARTNPQAGESASVAASAAPVSSTGDVAATPIPNAKVVNDPVSPPPQDAVLGTHRWGYRSSHVTGARDEVTSDLHIAVEGNENDLLTQQQSSELLHIFRHSKGVRRAIEADGGDPDDASFWVRQVSANEDDVGNNTAWVTATLRADYPAHEGERGLEMQVYRQKTREGLLDNTPYVSATQVGYLDATGALVDPETIRFKN